MNTYQPTFEDTIWLRSKRFDLSLILGGALLTLALPLLAGRHSNILPALFWIWILVFEGPHFFSTWTRTYFDPKYLGAYSRLLTGSLVFFIFPALSYLIASNAGLNFYGFFIFCWSLYHNARQHYGFLGLYARKAALSEKVRPNIKKWIYLFVVPPQIYFLFSFKLPSAYPETSNLLGTLQHFVQISAPMVSVLSLIAYAFVLIRGKIKYPITITSYTIGCLIFYSAMFYFVASREPFFAGAQNAAQRFMLIAVMNSLFHNIQYLAIVWLYGKARASANSMTGIARAIHSNSWFYLGSCLLGGAVFGTIVWNLGDWTNVHGLWTQSESHLWAQILFFGIIGHHFYLDQKIWKPSIQKDVTSALLDKGAKGA